MRLIRQTTYESTGGDNRQKQKTRKPFDLRIFRIVHLLMLRTDNCGQEQITWVRAPVHRLKMIVMP